MSDTFNPRSKPNPGTIEIRATDGSLTLRQYTIKDAREAFALIDRNREHLSQFGDTTAAKYPTLKSFEDSIKHPENPKRIRFGVWNNRGVIVGTINLTPDSDNPKRGEIGFYLGKEFQGKGYMTKAVRLLTDYAFDSLGYEEVWGKVTVGNLASVGVLERNGYAESGTVEEEVGKTIIYTKTKA